MVAALQHTHQVSRTAVQIHSLPSFAIGIIINNIYPYPGLCTKCFQSNICKVSA